MLVGKSGSTFDPISGKSYPSGLQVAQGSAYAREVCKHEALYTQYGAPGRPYQFYEYPTMMYRPSQPKQGGPLEFEGQEACGEHERETFERAGFVHGGKAAAQAHFYAMQSEIGELAANRNFSDRKMSPEAQAEAARIDESTVSHLPAIEAAHPKSGRRG